MPHRHDPPTVGSGHALSQLPSIGALLRVGASTLFKSKPTKEAIERIEIPGALVEVELPPVSASILQEYGNWTGSGDTGGAVPTCVPPHLFPQWTFPPMIKALSGAMPPAA